jgi:hypothetical protein
MKEPIHIVVSSGAAGLKVHGMSLSTGEARSVYDKIIANPPGDIAEVFLFERLNKPAKSRRFTLRHGIQPQPASVAVQPPVQKLATIIRRGR